jgi:hypothetical protein
MKNINLWMFAAILTICGTTTMLTSCAANEDNAVEPIQQTDRDVFEEQLSVTLSDAVQLQNLQPTLHAAEVLTAFIEQLNMETLAPQFGNIMTSILANTKPTEFAKLGDQEAEAREALKNTFSSLADATMFSLTNAEMALGKTRMTFVEGEKEMKYETGVGEGLVIAYQNPTTNETREVTFKFNEVNDGVIMFVSKMSGIPMAIQFPANITFSLNHTQAGVPSEVIDGVVTLTAPNGRKFISVQGCEWNLGVATKAATADRFEVPMAFMHHYADGRVDGEVGLAINSTVVLGLTINSTGTPYNDTEMEQLKAMREKGAAFNAFYEVLKTFNSRSGKAQLTVMQDLEFNLDVKDIAQAVSAIGSAVSLRNSQPTKADIDPLTELLNNALTYTVRQRSTGKTAEGKFVTAEIEGIYQPTLALRFDGESDFQVMYDRLSSADHANFQSLLKSFDAPLRQFDKLFQAFDKKLQEFKKLNPLKGL